jgi:hypothetical protein
MTKTGHQYLTACPYDPNGKLDIPRTRWFLVAGRQRQGTNAGLPGYHLLGRECMFLPRHNDETRNVGEIFLAFHD